MSAHPELEHPVAEIKRTLEDLQETQPGLHFCVLVTCPDKQGDQCATFFATGDLGLAATVMHNIILESKDKTTDVPEAS